MLRTQFLGLARVEVFHALPTAPLQRAVSTPVIMMSMEVLAKFSTSTAVARFGVVPIWKLLKPPLMAPAKSTTTNWVPLAGATPPRLIVTEFAPPLAVRLVMLRVEADVTFTAASALKVRLPTVRTPAPLLPASTIPPLATVTVPFTVPVPRMVAPLCTVTPLPAGSAPVTRSDAVLLMVWALAPVGEPLTMRRPALTFVAPVLVFAAESVSVLAPVLFNAPAPETMPGRVRGEVVWSVVPPAFRVTALVPRAATACVWIVPPSRVTLLKVFAEVSTRVPALDLVKAPVIAPAPPIV